MAEHVVRLPDVGEGVAQAELVEWHVKPGDLVGAIVKLAKLPPREVGSIQIAERFSLVEVPEAIAEARAAGIAVAMITGDHSATALAIARQAGIDTAAGAVTGSQLAAMDDTAMAVNASSAQPRAPSK